MNKAIETKQETKPEHEDRIDEFAISQFQVLGYEGRLPDSIVETYLAFKRKKDLLYPARLTPGELVTVVFLAGLVDKMTKPAEKNG